MGEFDWILSQLPAVATVAGFAVAWAKMYYRFVRMEEHLRVLNHNSTAITRALLYRKIITPEDLKDGE